LSCYIFNKRYITSPNVVQRATSILTQFEEISSWVNNWLCCYTLHCAGPNLTRNVKCPFLRDLRKEVNLIIFKFYTCPHDFQFISQTQKWGGDVNEWIRQEGGSLRRMTFGQKLHFITSLKVSSLRRKSLCQKPNDDQSKKLIIL
jgi:hypothetical protein